MRGTKLLAWRVPPVWENLQRGEAAAVENSKVLAKQRNLLAATQAALDAVFTDVRIGLFETVGVNCSLAIGERSSVILDLPDGTDTEQIARAIDMENVEAWRDEAGRVHVGISPWLSTKDVDQTVLSPVKVIHVLLGIHASDKTQPRTFKQKFLSAVAEIANLQKKSKGES